MRAIGCLNVQTKRDLRSGGESSKMKLIGSICILLAGLVALPAKAQEPINATLIQLIANPEKFDGKLIRVIGFLRLEFEGDVLYLHREDYENAILGDGIWVDVTPEITKQSKTLNMNYVLLEGIFSSREHGHMGAWSGTITKVRRAQLWSDATQAKRREVPLPPRPPPRAPQASHY
jgi:hypothetical protein